MADIKKVFSKIYDKYISQIYRFIFLKVNSQEVAQDLTSETFLRGWEAFQNPKSKIKNQKEIKNPRAFLYRIARNLVIDHYREKGRIQIVPVEDTEIIDPRTNLEVRAAVMSDVENVKNVLFKLNDDYQNIIVWHYINDLSISEIANLLDRTEGATRVLLHRALKSLKFQIANSKPQTNSNNQNSEFQTA